MIITNYQLFCEDKLATFAKVKGSTSSHLYNQLLDTSNKNEFDDDAPFLNMVDVGGVKIFLKWNHHPKKHNLIDKIESRSQIHSMTELNELTKMVVIEIPKEIDGKIKKTGSYDFYLKSRKLHFVISIDFEQLKNDPKPEIFIYSIIRGVIKDNVIDTIEIDD